MYAALAVPLSADGLRQYRQLIDAFDRDALHRGDANGLKLHANLKGLLRGPLWENRGVGATTSPLAEAVAAQVQRLVKGKRRPIVFGNTADETEHFRVVLRQKGLEALPWARIDAKARKEGFDCVVANIATDAQGINMQHDGDCIVCRPTPGDVLEQMKGRVDRPGQRCKQLLLVVVFAGSTIEEAEFANIRLAGMHGRSDSGPHIATRDRTRNHIVGGTRAAANRPHARRDRSDARCC